MVQLDCLGLARIDHHSRILGVSIAGDLVALLGCDGGPTFYVSCPLNLAARVELWRHLLLRLDVQDLALRLAATPVPADGIARLRTLGSLSS